MPRVALPLIWLFFAGLICLGVLEWRARWDACRATGANFVVCAAVANN